MQCEKTIRVSWFLNEVSSVSILQLKCFKFTTKANIVKFISWVIKSSGLTPFLCISLQTALLIIGSLNESDSLGIPHFLASLVVQDTSCGTPVKPFRE